MEGFDCCMDFFEQAQVPTVFNTTYNINLYNEKTGEIQCHLCIPTHINSDGEINFSQIANYFFSNKIISNESLLYYYDIDSSAYVLYRNGSCFLINQSIIFDEMNQLIHLKYREFLQTNDECFKFTEETSILNVTSADTLNESFISEISFEDSQTNQIQDLSLSSQQTVSKNSTKKFDGRSLRHKERTIEEVEELIKRWREFYDGVFDPVTKKIVKYKLADAAAKVGVPKKSLDDYQIMLKHGERFGFDFASKKKEGFGTLRNFLNKMKNNKKYRGC